MNVMAKRPCIDCNAPTDATRCPTCARRNQTTKDARRGTTTQRGYGWPWQQVSRQAIALHLATYGLVCPGWQVPAHTTQPGSLTTDHIVAKAHGGTDSLSNCQVLCRPCNSRKGATTRRAG